MKRKTFAIIYHLGIDLSRRKKSTIIMFNKRTIYSFILSALFLLPLSVQGRDIVIEKDDHHTGARSVDTSTITASIDDQVITVSFSDLTASQIVVRDSANLTVFNQTFASAFSAQADLTSLTNGIYTLYIYAMGYWWYGQFEIE